MLANDAVEVRRATSSYVIYSFGRTDGEHIRMTEPSSMNMYGLCGMYPRWSLAQVMESAHTWYI